MLSALVVFGALQVPVAEAGRLSPQSLQEFNNYTKKIENRIESRLKAKQVLWAEDAGRLEAVRKGEIAVENLAGKRPIGITGGLIHDWVGTVFIPGVNMQKLLGLLQDYDRHKSVYKPEVIGSKTLSREGDHFRIRFRLMKKKVLTVVLDTDYDVIYRHVDPRRCFSRSITTRMAEVENAGGQDERVGPPDTGHGFMWRLSTYWLMVEQDGGVYVECRAVSLSRGVPIGLNWMIQPIIGGLPRESLENTLRITRETLTAKQ